jgi:hypothetical protein
VKKTFTGPKVDLAHFESAPANDAPPYRA